MKNLLIILFSIFSFSSTLAQYNSLQINDPQSWGSTKGSIDEAIVSMKPQGLFMEYGLYLTFSAKGSYFEGNSNDTLEVVLDFTLPSEAMIIDSWLWIYDDICKAILIDKWEASNIYEDIVDRRQDPSILTKKSATQYQLRVFPMAGNETRKVKINYLLPMQWQNDQVINALPVDILTTSKKSLPHVDLVVWGNDAFGPPSFINGGELGFQNMNNEAFGPYKFSQIPLMNNIKVAFDSPLSNGYYLATAPDDDESGTYQLAVLPGEFASQEKKRKLIFMVDHEFNKSDVGKNEIFEVLQVYLDQMLSPSDSFNLLVSNFQIQTFSNNWMAATKENIEEACYFGKEKLADYSNLVPLLFNGIEFSNQDTAASSLILIANSDHYRDHNLANDLLDDILNTMEKEKPIHILDYQQKNIIQFGIGGVSYFGNEYFYSNLSHLTHGSFSSIFGNSQNNTFLELIYNGLTDLNGVIYYFDFSTGMENGFTYAKYDLHENGTINLSQPLLQIGKYYGDLPFKIELNALVDDAFFHKDINIQPDEMNVLDSTLSQTWSGLHLKEMEQNIDQSNAVIKNIINHSMNANVLSLYTAFLCLEDTSQYCLDCIDETELVDVPREEKTDTVITVSPNPFKDVVTINISGLDEVDHSRLSFQIFNSQGKLVRNFDPAACKIDDGYRIVWDASLHTNAQGMFFFVCRSENSLFTKKLIRYKE